MPLKATVLTDSAPRRRGFSKSAVWVYGVVFVGLIGLRVWAEEARVAPLPPNAHVEVPAPLWNGYDLSQVPSAAIRASQLSDLRYGRVGVMAYDNETVIPPPANSRVPTYLDYEASPAPMESIEPIRTIEPLRPGSLRRRYEDPRFTDEFEVTTSSRSGTTYYSGDVSGTTQRIGSFSYTTLDAGGRTVSGTTSHVGRMSYTNWSDGTSATTQHLGRMSYTNSSDGRSATTQHIGNFSYTTGSDGYSATTQRVGNFSYTTVSP